MIVGERIDRMQQIFQLMKDRNRHIKGSFVMQIQQAMNNTRFSQVQGNQSHIQNQHIVAEEKSGTTLGTTFGVRSSHMSQMEKQDVQISSRGRTARNQHWTSRADTINEILDEEQGSYQIAEIKPRNRFENFISPNPGLLTSKNNSVKHEGNELDASCRSFLHTENEQSGESCPEMQ